MAQKGWWPTHRRGDRSTRVGQFRRRASAYSTSQMVRLRKISVPNPRSRRPAGFLAVWVTAYPMQQRSRRLPRIGVLEIISAALIRLIPRTVAGGRPAHSAGFHPRFRDPITGSRHSDSREVGKLSEVLCGLGGSAPRAHGRSTLGSSRAGPRARAEGRVPDAFSGSRYTGRVSRSRPLIPAHS